MATDFVGLATGRECTDAAGLFATCPDTIVNMTNSEETASERVVRIVQTTRKRLGWSATRLAEECAKHGHPEVTDQVIYNLEQRRREDVTADQVVAFAKALAIPAHMLIEPTTDSTAVFWFRSDAEQRAFGDALRTVYRTVGFLATPDQLVTPDQEGA
jgi:transcriptional regulator with XRE-family HTH domain